MDSPKHITLLPVSVSECQSYEGLGIEIIIANRNADLAEYMATPPPEGFRRLSKEDAMRMTILNAQFWETLDGKDGIWTDYHGAPVSHGVFRETDRITFKKDLNPDVGFRLAYVRDKPQSMLRSRSAPAV